MAIDRRTFIQSGIASSAVAGGVMLAPSGFESSAQQVTKPLTGIHSITPVVGDGKWVWDTPPAETGYLEPRDYEFEVAIELRGKGPAKALRATTPVPTELPEQKIRTKFDQSSIETQGCVATLRPVSAESAQLVLAAPSIVRGQAVSAAARMRMTLFKQHHAFDEEQFPAEQPKHSLAFRKQYLFDSPGIQVRAPQVRNLQKKITGNARHPWYKARQIYEWVWENIQARIGNYTSVIAALKNRVGDCEERAACFIALCRSAGIPARLVWVPNHNWAEFYLAGTDGSGHWIPAHTAAYSWFGWTGVHELVIQKGDNLNVPEKRQPQRLLADWAQWQGVRPEIRYYARIRPLPNESNDDPGPGERSKNQQGRWILKGSHRMDDLLRDGRGNVLRDYPKRF